MNIRQASIRTPRQLFGALLLSSVAIACTAGGVTGGPQGGSPGAAGAGGSMGSGGAGSGGAAASGVGGAGGAGSGGGTPTGGSGGSIGAAGQFPNYPNGNTDNTHLQEGGARIIIQIVLADLYRQGLAPGTLAKAVPQAP